MGLTMRHKARVSAAWLAWGLMALTHPLWAQDAALVSGDEPALPRVVLHSSRGDILVELEVRRAPVTVRNFLRYVDQKRLDGSDFYRAVKIGDDGKYGLVQGGLRGNPKRVLKPIAHESPRTTGLSHLDGVISMARTDPGTATADFFFVVGDLVALDGQASGDEVGYAAFGRVVEGMDVVRDILEQPRSVDDGEGVMKGQMLAKPVKIISVRREAASAIQK